jgi:flagellar biosynthesis protein FlhA
MSDAAKQLTGRTEGGPKRRSPFALIGTDNLFAGAMVAVIAVMIVPLPSFIMDLLLSFSISAAMVVFILSLNIEKPLDLSSFPSILLVLTLVRLSLNVASTRLILSKGDQGADNVSRVIKSFGEFVVGGNYVLGIIIFLILVLINFVVITKGSGRIAEVSARFTLDAMPGKQMAIDAELAAGALTEAEAKQRREDIQTEANFFGAMDGAAKFVRGDAIAGLVITAINIIGGLIIGTMQQDMDVGEAAKTYTMLTVGDGLASQLPSLLTSVASGVIVTRTSTPGALGDTVMDQVLGPKRPLVLSAVFLGALGVVPGMPHLPFLLLAAGMAYMGLKSDDPATEEEELEEQQEAHSSKTEREREELESLLPVDLLEVEVGYELVPLVDGNRDGALLGRINGIRKQLAQDLGVVVPPIHMRDNLQLRPGEYRVMLCGNNIGSGVLQVGALLAMNPSGGRPDLNGEGTTEPAFGLPAKWISPADSERAELMGYTVVDAATVAATHLGELLARNCHLLIGRREFQELIELHSRENEKVIEELIPNILGPGHVIKVLRNLLSERISIRDFRTILETLADFGEDIKDPDQLTEVVRQRLSKQLTASFLDTTGNISALVLSPPVEMIFRRLQNPASGGVLNAEELQGMLDQFQHSVSTLPGTEGMPVVVVPADIRRSVMMFVGRHIPGISVLSFREIESDANLQTIGVVGGASDGQLRGAA